ncbi:MAG: hypothetical protein M1274_15730 [Actinobacteria bacterium]|nr:hypothetical protein [Actinomycetota bacterium]
MSERDAGYRPPITAAMVRAVIQEYEVLGRVERLDGDGNYLSPSEEEEG